MKTKFVVSLLLVALLISACAPSVPATEEAPLLTVTEEPLPVDIQTESPLQPEQPASTTWKVVRDEHYGFGLAVPCWWLVSPIPAEGSGGVMTIKNFDQTYFNANSDKGFWEWPNGALKLDVMITGGIDPAKSDTDAFMQFVDPTTTGLVSAEQQQFGAHTATVMTFSNLVNTSNPDEKLFVFRLAPDKLLTVAPIPQNIIDTPDFQAILASVVLTSDEQVTLPTITPAPALINASCAQ
jgi:hypothetical protein